MRIRKHDIGKDRWHLTVWPDGWMERGLFEEWVRDNIPGSMCAYRFNDGSPYIEVRGSDPGDCMLLMLRWSL